MISGGIVYANDFGAVGSGVGYIENVLDTSHQINGSVTYTV